MLAWDRHALVDGVKKTVAHAPAKNGGTLLVAAIDRKFEQIRKIPRRKPATPGAHSRRTSKLAQETKLARASETGSCRPITKIAAD